MYANMNVKNSPAHKRAICCVRTSLIISDTPPTKAIVVKTSFARS